MEHDDIKKLEQLILLYKNAESGSKQLYAKQIRSMRKKTKKLDEFLFKTLKLNLENDIEVHFDSSVITPEMKKHTHNYYEIIFCNNGNVKYLIGEKIYDVSYGDIIIIPPNIMHGPLHYNNNNEPYERYVLWLDATFFANEIKNDSMLVYAFENCNKNNYYVLHTEKTMSAKIKTLFGLLFNEKNTQKPGWSKVVYCHALHLIVEISRILYYNSSICANNTDDLVKDIVMYIEENLSNKITIEILSDHFFVSKSTISHLFKKQLDVSPSHYIIQRRLEEAKLQIADNIPLYNIMQSCGFSDYSSFYKLFKKYYGISPKQYYINTKT